MVVYNQAIKVLEKFNMLNFGDFIHLAKLKLIYKCLHNQSVCFYGWGFSAFMHSSYCSFCFFQVVEQVSFVALCLMDFAYDLFLLNTAWNLKHCQTTDDQFHRTSTSPSTSDI